MTSLKLAVVAGLASVAYLGGNAQAALINFDPDGAAVGNGAITVATFDFAPGNSIAVDGVPLAATPSSDLVDQYFQARLNGFLDATSNPVTSVVGLNSVFEITVVAGVSTNGQIVVATGTSAIATFSLAAAPTVNYVELYYDSNPLTFANDLAGTGFRDGTLIMRAEISDLAAVFSSSFAPADIVQFDQFPSLADDNYGIDTVSGNGSLSFDADILARDASFFLDNLAVIGVDATTNNVTPFVQTNPSGLFEIGPNGGGPYVNLIPDLGLVNGLSLDGDKDIQLQTDASASFVIPEPASLSMLAMAVGLIGLRRRRA
jgi:hypothetical protein